MKMTEEQKKLYAENSDIAGWLACKCACMDNDPEMLEKVADKMLRVAISKYKESKHGDFEEYAEKFITPKLKNYINSGGDVDRIVRDGVEEEEEIIDRCAGLDSIDFLERCAGLDILEDIDEAYVVGF